MICKKKKYIYIVRLNKKEPKRAVIFPLKLNQFIKYKFHCY